MPIDTTGWVAVANNASGYDINDVHAPLWSFPSEMDPGEIVYRGDIIGDNIYWRTSRDGWVLILDETSNVVDFVVWGYSADDLATLNLTVGGFSGNPAEVAWSGAPLSNVGASSEALQRTGSSAIDPPPQWGFGKFLLPVRTKCLTGTRRWW